MGPSEDGLWRDWPSAVCTPGRGSWSEDGERGLLRERAPLRCDLRGLVAKSCVCARLLEGGWFVDGRVGCWGSKDGLWGEDGVGRHQGEGIRRRGRLGRSASVDGWVGLLVMGVRGWGSWAWGVATVDD